MLGHCSIPLRGRRFGAGGGGVFVTSASVLPIFAKSHSGLPVMNSARRRRLCLSLAARSFESTSFALVAVKRIFELRTCHDIPESGCGGDSSIMKNIGTWVTACSAGAVVSAVVYEWGYFSELGITRLLSHYSLSDLISQSFVILPITIVVWVLIFVLFLLLRALFYPLLSAVKSSPLLSAVKLSPLRSAVNYDFMLRRRVPLEVIAYFILVVPGLFVAGSISAKAIDRSPFTSRYAISINEVPELADVLRRFGGGILYYRFRVTSDKTPDADGFNFNIQAVLTYLPVDQIDFIELLGENTLAAPDDPFDIVLPGAEECFREGTVLGPYCQVYLGRP